MVKKVASINLEGSRVSPLTGTQVKSLFTLKWVLLAGDVERKASLNCCCKPARDTRWLQNEIENGMIVFGNVWIFVHF